MVIRFGIDSSSADWYVKWAEQFAASIKRRSLRQRTPKDKKKEEFNPDYLNIE
jgi:hypothetical protein